MIKKYTRLLLAWLVMLAVPVQGFAAISAGTCMALGHHEVLAEAVHGPDAAHGSHADAATGGHVHDAPDGDAADAHCGPCVACCAAAAIPIASSLFSPIVSLGAVEAFIAAPPPEFLSELLHRPPLTLLA